MPNEMPNELDTPTQEPCHEQMIWDVILFWLFAAQLTLADVPKSRGLDLSLTLQGAGGIGGLLARTDTNGSTFYHCDGSGNVTALIDDNQSIVARYEYDGFGKLIGKWGTYADLNTYRFSSKEVQRNSGLYCFGRRFYDPAFQRWLNRDPLGTSGGINPYRFARNNALRWLDKYGLRPEGEEEEKELDSDAYEFPVLDALFEALTGIVNDVKADEADAAAQEAAAQANQTPDSQGSQGDNAPPSTITVKCPVRTYQTYFKYNPQTGQFYSGRTSGTGTPEENVENRDDNHHKNDEGYEPAQLDKSSTNPDAIRGQEQLNIEANGGAQSQGGTSGNAINGISPQNPNGPNYIDAAKQEFGVK